MIRQGVDKVLPDRHDYSILHTLGMVKPWYKRIFEKPQPGAVNAGLPDNFSIYDGRIIPDQSQFDERFVPNLPPLWFACTGETGTFDCGLQDNDLYNPKDAYDNTEPFRADTGRDMRKALKNFIDRGPRKADGTFGPKRKAYFNCYGAGDISDFEAARTALWLNQAERRGVWVATWWYRDFDDPYENGSLPMPSFDIKDASLHCYLVTGWRTTYGFNGKHIVELEAIPWCGMRYGLKGLVYLDEVKYNALMVQPYTGAFTQTKLDGLTPVPVGFQAVIDHWVYYVRNLLRV